MLHDIELDHSIIHIVIIEASCSYTSVGFAKARPFDVLHRH